MTRWMAVPLWLVAVLVVTTVPTVPGDVALLGVALAALLAVALVLYTGPWWGSGDAGCRDHRAGSR